MENSNIVDCCTPEVETTNANTGCCTPEVEITNANTGCCTPEVETTNANTGCCTPEVETTNANTGCCTPEVETTNETKTQYLTNNYAKSSPNYLKSMFGTTDVMPLWIADMDFKVAEPITNELQRLVNRGNFSYEFNASQVHQALVDWNKKRHGLQLEAKNFLQVSGVLTGIALLIRELTKEGDGILVQTPVYHQFFKVIETANRKVVKNPLKIVEGQYQMDFENLERQLKTQQVKIILLCNPHNPVGRVWKKDELQQLIQLANQYNVTIISDEIHSDIVYANSAFNSIASFSDSSQHIAVLGSPAKTFGMQSISHGYLYIPNVQTHKRVKNTIASLYLDHGNALTTFATLAAYTKGEEWLDETVAYFEKTVNWVEDYVKKEIPNVKMFRPDGTYQIWLDFSQLNLSTKVLNQLLVQQAKLALTPGSWFGDDATQFMRMNIAAPLAKIQRAFYQLKKAIDQGADALVNVNETEVNSCCGC